MLAIDNSSIDMTLDSSVMIRSRDDGEIYTRETGVQQSSIMTRLFPWIQTGPTAKICNSVKDNELIAQKTKDKNSVPLSMPQEMNVKSSELKSTTTVNSQSLRKESTVNNPPQAFSIPNDSRRVSVLEMWNLIESVGIKRAMVDKALTTDEAIAELYYTIERRIHTEREQDMIKRLREHIAKSKKARESDKSALLVKSA